MAGFSRNALVVGSVLAGGVLSAPSLARAESPDAPAMAEPGLAAPAAVGTSSPVEFPPSTTGVRWAVRLQGLYNGLGASRDILAAAAYGIEGAVLLGSWEVAAGLNNNTDLRFAVAAGWRHESGFLVRSAVSVLTTPASYVVDRSGARGESRFPLSFTTAGWEWRLDHWSLALGAGMAVAVVEPGDSTPYLTGGPAAEARAGWIF